MPTKRAALAKALGDIVLAEGIDALSLRPAAARLDTSGRMLLYYFGTKDALVADVLADISDRMAASFAAMSTRTPLAPFEMLREASALLALPEVRPFMDLWAEMVARAIRGDPTFRRAVDRTMASWIGRIQARTVFPDGVDPVAGAAAMLTVIEGLATLGALAPRFGNDAAVLTALRACL